nr:MAG TPA: hypothetical protein [Bacteriophage sp.]
MPLISYYNIGIESLSFMFYIASLLPEHPLDPFFHLNFICSERNYFVSSDSTLLEYISLTAPPSSILYP